FILYYISTIILPTKSTIFPYTTLFRSTKNKPILYEHLEEFVDLFKHPEKRNATNKKVSDDCNDWTVKVSDIKDYDISAKNPNKIIEVIHESPKEIIAELKANDEKIDAHLRRIE